MKEIDIGRLKEVFRYDPDTGLLCRKNHVKPAGWVTGEGYRKARIDGLRLLVHRIIWAMHYGDWPETLDHINGDRLDNKLSNLRSVTRFQNSSNQRKRSKCELSSKFKGVVWVKSRRKWQVQIGHGGKRTYVGKFDCEQKAAHAYNKAAIEIFGEFAVLNPVGVEK